MKNQILALSALCVLLVACEKNKPSANTNQPATMRDRNEQSMAPNGQGSQSDQAVTQNIRAALMDDDSLSANAKNVKISTVDGVVTLTGQVNSRREKHDVARIAKSVNGIRNIDNQLQVNRPDNQTGMRSDSDNQ